MNQLGDTLREYRPSQNEQFTQRVQFLIAVRTGDLSTARRLLQADPSFVRATLPREQWGEPEMVSPPSRWSSTIRRCTLRRPTAISTWPGCSWRTAQLSTMPRRARPQPASRNAPRSGTDTGTPGRRDGSLAFAEFSTVWAELTHG